MERIAMVENPTEIKNNRFTAWRKGRIVARLLWSENTDHWHVVRETYSKMHGVKTTVRCFETFDAAHNKLSSYKHDCIVAKRVPSYILVSVNDTHIPAV